MFEQNFMSEILEAEASINDFYEDINFFKYQSSFNELSFSRAKKNYNVLLKRLAELKLPDPKQFIYNKISLEELTSILREILLKLFGSSHYDQIKEYESLIAISPIDDYFDSIIEEDISKTAATVKKIYISDKLYNIQIASTGHEFTHAFLNQYKGEKFNSHICNIHYNELLSVLIEYIICYELSKILKDQHIISSHEVIRINHDHAQASEYLSTQATIPYLVKTKAPILPFFKKYEEYQSHNAFTYIIADIYSIHLLENYLNDPQTLLKIIRHIIEGQQSLQDLINYYNLSLRNPDTLRLYDEQINRTLKYKK